MLYVLADQTLMSITVFYFIVGEKWPLIGIQQSWALMLRLALSHFGADSEYAQMEAR